MNLSDMQKRLQAPFPAHMISWKPATLNRDRSRALLLAHIDARAVQDRLDAICPACGTPKSKPGWARCWAVRLPASSRSAPVRSTR